MHPQASSILSAWQSIEALKAISFKDPAKFIHDRDPNFIKDNSRIIFFNDGPLPWESSQRTPLAEGHRYIYQLGFGMLKLNRIYNHLLQAFDEPEPIDPPSLDYAAIAMIPVREDGSVSLADKTSISSFAWAFPLALNNQLDLLHLWNEVQIDLCQKLGQLLTHNNDQVVSDSGYNQPYQPPPSLTKQMITDAFREFINILGIDPADVEENFFLVEKVQSDKFFETNEMPLLNSFFLNDLNLAKNWLQGDHAGSTLGLYLQQKTAGKRMDILDDQAYLRELTSPQNIPLGRWPSGKNSLVLLQQAAVNAVCHRDNPQNLITINGPPGTGKTTIIRDIVANSIVERAQAMCAFDDPEKAFTYQKDVKVYGEISEFYALDPRITGFEMVVASSNNNAVENISKELADIDAIQDDMSSLGYFNTTSDAIHHGHILAAERRRNGYKKTPHNNNTFIEHRTWGLIAAVLGNRSNRSIFRQAFWRNDDVSLESYLKSIIAGSDENPQPAGSENIMHNNCSIIQECQPPDNKSQALQKWHKAVQVFQETVQTTQQQLTVLQDAHQIIQQLKDARQRHQEFLQSTVNIEHNIFNSECEAIEAELAVDRYHHQVSTLGQTLQHHECHKPPIWNHFFKRSVWQQWRHEMLELRQLYRRISEHLEQLKTKFTAADNERLRLTSILNSIPDNINAFAEFEFNCEQDLTSARLMAAGHLADHKMWAQQKAELHTSTLWLSQEMQRNRDRVFAAALMIHKTFIGAAARPLYYNLDILLSHFGGMFLSKEHDPIFTDLWRSLFLVTPLVSTTFASVEQMFAKLPAKSLGWLIIDEAGQVLPQACVGAMMRCQQAVVLGDPLQIEPINSLPDKLLDAICRSYNVDPDAWSPSRASVQICADRASKLGTYVRRSNNQQAWVGLPLLVHRRCHNPMFDIANKMAYNNAMVHAVNTDTDQQPFGQQSYGKKSMAIEKVLGPSSWHDIVSESKDKWSADEGHYVLGLLDNLLVHGFDKPDIFVITPFKNVMMEMREIVSHQFGTLLNRPSEQVRWLIDRIGTVHTFQGKEAEAVIFLLGAPESNEYRAREWAGRRPNLLNVAVTRAKKTLHIVGSRQAWSNIGVFQNLAAAFPNYDDDIDLEWGNDDDWKQIINC